MNLLQWVPLIATLVLLKFLRWWHIGVTDFKVFVLILLVWSFLLILFYHRTRSAKIDGAPAAGAIPDATLSKED